MTFTEQEKNKCAGYALAILLVAIVLLCFGCSSTKDCDCPEFNLPEVVEKHVRDKARLLPTPSPPEYIVPKDEVDIGLNWSEVVRAWLECQHNTNEHNRSILEGEGSE